MLAPRLSQPRFINTNNTKLLLGRVRSMPCGGKSGRRPIQAGVSHAPLSILPLRTVIRSFVTSSFSSSHILLPISLYILGTLAHTTNPLLDVRRNPVIRAVLNNTLYAQFCAGETASEVRQAVTDVKNIGFSGVILAYAKESPIEPNAGSETSLSPGPDEEARAASELAAWADAMLGTVKSMCAGDFAALKFTGAGRETRRRLARRMPPGARLDDVMKEICQCARQQGVRIAFDGEQHEMQVGVDDWTMRYAREHNKGDAPPMIYGTYQAYKRTTSEVLSQHLAQAQREGFSVGVKLVRGAYLELDPRELIFATKQETDDNYEAIAAAVLTRRWCDSVTGSGAFPDADLMLATHNAHSVQRAYDLVMRGDARSKILFAQLQGMADEISCGLVEVSRAVAQGGGGAGRPEASVLPVYKYMAWGSTVECMRYLMRRAEENKEAVARTREDRDAMWAELVRRFKRVFSSRP